MDVSNLSRYQKGYLYEYYIWYTLDIHNFEYSSNPQVYSEWLKTTNTGYDIIVKINDNLWLKVECKYTSKPIYHSWFMRDWYSRDCDIIVTNCKWHIPYKDRKLLMEKNVKLFDTHEFLWYILKLHRHFNKYYLNYVFRLISILLNSVRVGVNLRKSIAPQYEDTTQSSNIVQLKNDTLFILTGHMYPSTTREGISSNLQECWHIKSMGFSSYPTPISGLEGGLM